MKPRTKIRTLESAPPQYRNRKAWAMAQNGNYWTVVFEGGGEASLHISEFEADEPIPADEAGMPLLAGFAPDTEGGATD